MFIKQLKFDNICIMKKFFIITTFVLLICTTIFSFSFSENLYPINDKSGGGYINKNGVVVLEQKYNFAERFVDNYAIVQGKNLKYGIIDKKGNIVVNFEFDNMDNLSENFVTYKKYNKYGYIDIIKNIKSGAVYDNIKKFKEGLAVIYIYNDTNEVTTGFMDKKGKIKYALTFSIPKNSDKDEFCVFENFSSNMAQITIDYKTGYINNKFELVIPPIYEFARDFEGDLAYVKFEDIEGYINKKGQWVWAKPREWI